MHTRRNRQIAVVIVLVTILGIGWSIWIAQPHRSTPTNQLETALLQATTGKDLKPLELGVTTKEASKYFLVRTPTMSPGIMGELPPGVEATLHEHKTVIVFSRKNENTFLTLVYDKNTQQYTIDSSSSDSSTQTALQKIITDSSRIFHQQLNDSIHKL